jgi:hypothetical protein
MWGPAIEKGVFLSYWLNAANIDLTSWKCGVVRGGVPINVLKSRLCRGVTGVPVHSVGSLLEMVMEILTLMGNLPRPGCVIVSKTWEKKFRKSIGIFIINASEILQHVKISHVHNIFWKIYHTN